MSFSLLATDLDGTLLNSRGELHAEDADAIRELLARGVHVTFATGRMHSGCGHLARELGLTTPLVCLDGGQIVDPQSRAPLHTTPLPEAHVGDLRQLLRDTRPMTFVFQADRIVHDAAGDRAAPYVSIWTRDMHRVDDVLDHSSLAEQALGLVTVGEEARIRDLERTIHEQLPALQTAAFISSRAGFEGVWAMLIRSRGISKASGLERLVEQLGGTMKDVVAVGDWLNDVSMLSAAGRSYAMGQAPPEVARVADEQLPQTERTGGGVAEAARRAGLL